MIEQHVANEETTKENQEIRENRLTRLERTRNAAHEYGASRVNVLLGVEGELGIAQAPGPYLHGLVAYARTRDADEALAAVVDHAGGDERVHALLQLEEQKRVALGRKLDARLGLVRPVDVERAEASELAHDLVLMIQIDKQTQKMSIASLVEMHGLCIELSSYFRQCQAAVHLRTLCVSIWPVVAAVPVKMSKKAIRTKMDTQRGDVRADVVAAAAD